MIGIRRFVVRFLVMLQWYRLMALIKVRANRKQDIQVVVVMVWLRDAPHQNSVSEGKLSSMSIKMSSSKEEIPEIAEVSFSSIIWSS